MSKIDALGKRSLIFGRQIHEEFFDEVDKETGQGQVEGQGKHRHRDRGPTDPIREGEDQDPRSDFTPWPQANRKGQPFLPMGLSTVTKEGKHLAYV